MTAISNIFGRKKGKKRAPLPPSPSLSLSLLSLSIKNRQVLVRIAN